MALPNQPNLRAGYGLAEFLIGTWFIFVEIFDECHWFPFSLAAGIEPFGRFERSCITWSQLSSVHYTSSFSNRFTPKLRSYLISNRLTEYFLDFINNYIWLKPRHLTYSWLSRFLSLVTPSISLASLLSENKRLKCAVPTFTSCSQRWRATVNM